MQDKTKLLEDLRHYLNQEITFEAKQFLSSRLELFQRGRGIFSIEEIYELKDVFEKLEISFYDAEMFFPILLTEVTQL